MFISSLLLLFLSIKESVGRMILLGSVLLLKSLPRHHRGNNSKEVFFFEENILRHANEKSQYIFYGEYFSPRYRQSMVYFNCNLLLQKFEGCYLAEFLSIDHFFYDLISDLEEIDISSLDHCHK